MYFKYTIIDNDDPTRVYISKVTMNKNMALCDAAGYLKTTNVRIVAEHMLTDFERWAHFKKGLLIDKAGGKYKSIETQACFETWKDAQESPLFLLKSLTSAHKNDRRINKKLKTDIRKDFDIINSLAQAEKFIYEHP